MQKVVGSSPIIRSSSSLLIPRPEPNESVHSERPPICVSCGVTMVPAALSAHEDPQGEWVCLECEELAEDE